MTVRLPATTAHHLSGSHTSAAHVLPQRKTRGRRTAAPATAAGTAPTQQAASSSSSRPPPAPPSNTNTIYLLRTTLLHSNPPIWRELLIHGGTDAGTLHRVLQLVYGWSSAHAHQFTVPAAVLGNGASARAEWRHQLAHQRLLRPALDLGTPVAALGHDGQRAEHEADEATVTLAEVLPTRDTRVLYEYDFGTHRALHTWRATRSGQGVVSGS